MGDSQGSLGSPRDVLCDRAKEWGICITDEVFATKLDAEDPLGQYRHKFFYPKAVDMPAVDLSLVEKDEEAVYLCGHSLGLAPRRASTLLDEEMQQWHKLGTLSRFYGKIPVEHCDEDLLIPMAEIVGAKQEEVVIMNGLSVNLHLFMISFYRPTCNRYKVLLEDKAFPSDHYVIESQIKLHGFDPDASMVFLKPREGEYNLRTEDILSVIEEEGASIAVILIPGIQYRTGQLFNLQAITAAGHAEGCYVGADLAHAAGNVRLRLHDWNVDFACWCTYKYLNSGHGSLGAAFLHKRHHNNKFPKLTGWWGHKFETRFNMDNVMEFEEGANAYRISNTSPFLCAHIRASLEIFHDASMHRIVTKSKFLTAYMEILLEEEERKSVNGTKFTIMTPSDPDQRGAMLTICIPKPVVEVYKELEKRGVVVDKREPNILRFGPAPLYNSFHDVFRCVQKLRQALQAV